jgi:hypothetical protein
MRNVGRDWGDVWHGFWQGRDERVRRILSDDAVDGIVLLDV